MSLPREPISTNDPEKLSAPRGWRWERLNEVARLESGHTPSRRQPEYWGGDIRWLSLKDIRGLNDAYVNETEDMPTPEGIANSSARLLPADTVAFCRTASVGNVAILGREMATSQDFVNWVCGEGLDPKYLYWALKSSQRLYEKEKTGTTHKTIYMPTVERFSVLRPSIHEQKRIAAILDKADAIRRKCQQAIALTEDLLRSAFLEMFGDPMSGTSSWNTATLDGVCTRITDGTHQSPGWTDDGVPFLFISNIVDGKIDFSTRRFISEETWAELTRRCPIEVDDILYTTVGSYGNCARVESEMKFAFQRHIAHIKPNPDKVLPEFLVAMLDSPGVRRQADRQARGVAQKTLNLKELKAFVVFVPPIARQHEFVMLRQRILGALDRERAVEAESGNLFGSLSQRAFRGEL